jgi:ketosteroid isomerase-like protein
MSDNKALIQSLYAAFGRGDVPFILAHLADSVEWVSSCDAPVIPWGGTRHGQNGALSFFTALGSNLDFERFEPLQYAADGDLVFVRGRTVAKVKGTGRRFDSEWVHVFTIANGQVARFQEFYDTAAIVAALRAN